MPGAVTRFHIEGMEKLVRKLSKMDKRVGKKIARQSINAAARPVEKLARSKVPTRTGTLRKSIGRRARSYKGRVFYVAIGARRGFDTVGPGGESIRPTLYAHLVEFGTFRTPAKPFLRPAIDQGKGQAMAVLRSRLSSGIEAAARGT